MPRNARVVVAGAPHHVTQWGNNRQAIFFTDGDRRLYLDILGEQARRWGLTVHGYCLMPNHLHLMVTPKDESSLAGAVGRTHWLYAQAVNRRRRRSGHLWQGRFFSAALDAAHFLEAMRYVERNPVRARLVRRAWLYRWSSAAAHVTGSDSTGLLEGRAWRAAVGKAEWKAALTRADDDPFVERLRRSTSRGRPLGSDRFVTRLETLLGKPLRARPIGRPRKNAVEPRSPRTRGKKRSGK